MAGYIFFVLGVLILQSATFASSVSPDGRAFLPRSLLHGRFLLQACTDPCATGEAYKLSPEGEVIAPCTCFQVNRHLLLVSRNDTVCMFSTVIR